MCGAGIQTIARCWNSEDCTAPIPLNSFEPPFVTIVDCCPDHERAECIGVGGSGGCRPGTLNFWDPLSHAELFGNAKMTIKHTRTDGCVLVSFEIFFH